MRDEELEMAGRGRPFVGEGCLWKNNDNLHNAIYSADNGTKRIQ